MPGTGVESTREVGQSPPRVDGEEKVTGRALYLDDMQFAAQLWGRTIRSSVAHGLIKKVRFDPSFDWARITRVTASDIPGENVIHLIEDDQPCLADGLVRHHRDRHADETRGDRALLSAGPCTHRRKSMALPERHHPVA